MEPQLLSPGAVRRTFDRVASLYDGHAVLEQEVASRLLDRLEYHRLTPQRIVDVGCGTGLAGSGLKNTFRKARIIGLDSSHAMLLQLRHRPAVFHRLGAVCADMSALPLADQSSDLLFSNLAMQWCLDPASLFAEFRRVLSPGGMLLFSSFGPGSLKELRASWAEVTGTAQTMEYIDILQFGDALMAAGFQEPVMDAERITVSYPNIDSLVRELDATGTSGLLQGGSNLEEAKDYLDRAYQPFMVKGRYPVTYEIIYGAAFGPQEGQPRKTPQGDVVTFSVESLRESGRNKC